MTQSLQLQERLAHYYNHAKLIARVSMRHRAFRAACESLLASELMSPADKELLQSVSLRVHRKDEMYYPGYEEVYLKIGLSAMRCIEEALAQSGRTDPVENVLDFPCGYGRVLRMLRARFPQATLVAGDIKEPMLTFVQRTFDAVPFLSNPRISELSMPHRFDLIWCGSLVTHLDEAGAADLLRFFYTHLAPGGLCVFSAHGPLSVEGIHIYGLTPAAEAQVLAGYNERGYGYADYEQYDNYGISIVTRERMNAIAQSVGDWREVYYVPYGWDNHHDVYAYLKPA